MYVYRECMHAFYLGLDSILDNINTCIPTLKPIMSPFVVHSVL